MPRLERGHFVGGEPLVEQRRRRHVQPTEASTEGRYQNVMPVAPPPEPEVLPDADARIADAIDEATLREDAYRLWRLGRPGCLRYKLDEHQKLAYDALRTWERIPLPTKDVENPGAARWWVDDWGRRVGKTHKNGVVLLEDGLWTPNSRMIYGTRTEVQMKEILVPTIASICEDAPPDIKPKYFTGRQGMRAGFHFPSTNSVLKLVGFDKDPDGARGTFLDKAALSEAAFMKDLTGLIVGIIGPQFMRRKYARGYLESSAPEDTEHDFDTFFVPDAKRRRAYWFYTFDDIQEKVIRDEAEMEYRQAASIDQEKADREYKGKRSRNFETTVFPEFDRARHIGTVEFPKFAQAVTAADPGQVHLFGLVSMVYAAEAETIIVADSWAQRNASSMKVAAATAAREFHHFGTWPHPRMKRLPLTDDGDSKGWRDLLAGDTYEHLASELYARAQTPIADRPDFEGRAAKFSSSDIPDHLTWWNGTRFMPNPAGRVSDVDLQFIRDLDEHYGLAFDPTNKQELPTMVRLVRDYLAEGRLVFLPSAGPVIEHVAAAQWTKGANGRRKFAEHKVFGHVDCASALVYGVRFIEQRYLNVRPQPPAALLLPREPGVQVQERLPWQALQPHEVVLKRQLEKLNKKPTPRLKGYRDR